MDAINSIQNEFVRRRAKNQSYSLRSFARDLEMSPGVLSQILSGKRALTPKTLSRISQTIPVAVKPSKLLASKVPDLAVIAEEEFSMVADWWNFAVLNLVDTKGFRSDANWIAKRLGIHLIQAQSALNTLKNLGYVEVVEGELKRSQPRVATSSNVPSAAIRRHHQQRLDLASNALNELSVDARDFSGLTIPVDSTKISEAKELIKEFRRRFLELTKSKDADQVFALAIQFFPLSKEESKIQSTTNNTTKK